MVSASATIASAAVLNRVLVFIATSLKVVVR
jgi:hypothetical protein